MSAPALSELEAESLARNAGIRNSKLFFHIDGKLPL
jgi:hypothetical protein